MGNPSRWHKFKVWFWRMVAGLLPRDLVYFVLIRVKYETTADQWPDDEPDKNFTLDSAIGRWHRKSIED